MAYLLDTHIVIWLANEPEKLTYDIQNILSDRYETIYFSSVNIWEMAIKKSVRQDFKVDIEKLHRYLLKMNYQELPVLKNIVVWLSIYPYYTTTLLIEF